MLKMLFTSYTKKFNFFIQQNKKSNVSVPFVSEVMFFEVLSTRQILGFIYTASKYVASFCFCYGMTDNFSIFA